jgi:CRP/FNR family transcriptional regulator
MKSVESIINVKVPLQRGERLFTAGDSFQSIYAVKSGSVKIYMLAEDGEEQVLGFYMPGELLGLDGLNGKFHTCTAEALETTSICEVPYPTLEKMYQDVPALQREMCALMSREISEDHQMLLLLAKRSAEERLASFLLRLSRRFKSRGFSPTEFNLSMSRHDIGNYLGLATETISRIFSRFHDERLISVHRRKVHIYNLHKLEEMIGVNVPLAKSA